MLENWLSSLNPPDKAGWELSLGFELGRKIWVLLLAVLSVGGCAKKESAIPVCIEGVLSAENHAHCMGKRYLEFSADPKEFTRRKNFARQLDEEGEANFAAGRYEKAYLSYSTSVVWVPSFRTMVKTGDAIFYRQASDMESGGVDGGENGCSRYFVSAAELHIPQTYDAALKFYAFERKRTGLRVSPDELEHVRQKSACLKELAHQYQNVSDACVDRLLIRQCLEQSG